LTKLIFGGDGQVKDDKGKRTKAVPATLEVGMTEANFSNKNLAAGGAIIISAWITHTDDGAISLVNVMGNSIGKEQLSKLQEIMHSKPNLMSLCGIADDATEADLSGLGMDADDAIILASELPDKGALTKFDISKNDIRAEGGKVLAEALKGNQSMTELSIAGNMLMYKADARSEADTDMSGVAALADVISDMRALTKLAMRKNNIHGAEAGKAFADMLAQNTVLKELDLSSQLFGHRGKALDAAFAKEFAVGINDNGTLTSLNLSSNDIGMHYDSQEGMMVATPEGIFVVVVTFVLTLYSM
jgi:hypothetical protein